MKKEKIKKIACISAIALNIVAICVLLFIFLPAQKSINVEIDNSKLTLSVGDTYKLAYTEIPDGYEEKWTSSNKEAVLVDTQGILYALEVGESTVTLQSGEYSDTIVVTVEEAVSEKNISYRGVGSNHELYLMTDSTFTLELEQPEAYDEVSLHTYSNLITINEMTLACGSQTGSAVVTVTAKKGDKKVVDVLTVYVSDDSYIGLNVNNIVLYKGESANVSIESIIVDGVEKKDKKNVTFEIADGSIASYKSGKVTAKSVGTTHLYAYYDVGGVRLSSYCNILVKEKVSEADFDAALKDKNTNYAVMKWADLWSGDGYTFTRCLNMVQTESKVGVNFSQDAIKKAIAKGYCGVEVTYSCKGANQYKKQGGAFYDVVGLSLQTASTDNQTMLVWFESILQEDGTYNVKFRSNSGWKGAYSQFGINIKSFKFVHMTDLVKESVKENVNYADCFKYPVWKANGAILQGKNGQVWAKSTKASPSLTLSSAMVDKAIKSGMEFVTIEASATFWGFYRAYSSADMENQVVPVNSTNWGVSLGANGGKKTVTATFRLSDLCKNADGTTADFVIGTAGGWKDVVMKVTSVTFHKPISYTIEHYLRNNKGNYVLDASRTQQMVAYNGAKAVAKPLNVEGYAYSKTLSEKTSSCTIEKGKTNLLKLYYDDLEYFIACQLKDEDFDWAANGVLSIFDAVGKATLSVEDTGIRINMNNDKTTAMAVNSDFIEKAVEEGYIALTFELKCYGMAKTDYWPKITTDSGNNTRKNVASVNAQIMQKTVMLADFLSGDVYDMQFGNSCAYSDSYMVLTSFKLEKPVTYTVEHHFKEVSGGYRLEPNKTQTFDVADGTAVTAMPLVEDGFAFNQSISKSTASGVVKKGEDLVLKLYYDDLESFIENQLKDDEFDWATSGVLNIFHAVGNASLSVEDLGIRINMNNDKTTAMAVDSDFIEKAVEEGYIALTFELKCYGMAKTDYWPKITTDSGNNTRKNVASVNAQIMQKTVMLADFLSGDVYDMQFGNSCAYSDSYMVLTSFKLEKGVPYTVEHYFRDTTWDYQIDTDKTQTFYVADGTEVTATPISVEGFSYNKSESENTASGVVKKGEELVLKLYYDDLDYFIERQLKNEDFDWATGGVLNIFHAVGNASLSVTDAGIRINMNNDKTTAMAVNSDFIAKAVEEGYFALTFELKCYGMAKTDYWPKITTDSGNNTRKNVASVNAQTMQKTVMLADFLSGDVYDMQFGNACAYSDSYMVLTSFKLVKGVPYTVEHYFSDASGQYHLDANKTMTFYAADGAEVTATPISVDGFTYNKNKSESTASGVAKKGEQLVLKLYYDLSNYIESVVEQHIDDSTYNWATSGIQELFSFSDEIKNNVTADANGITVTQVPAASRIRVNTYLLSRAADKGYTGVYFELKHTNTAATDRWPTAYTNTTALGSKNATTLVGYVSLARLLSGDTYDLRFGAGTSNGTLQLTKLCFSFGEVQADTNYAERSFDAIWKSNQTLAYTYNKITSTHATASNQLTISGEMLAAAEKSGHLRFTVEGQATFAAYMQCKTEDGSVILPTTSRNWNRDNSITNCNTFSATFSIEDFKNGDSYENVKLISSNSAAGDVLTITSLKFDNVDILALAKENLSASENYADEKYMGLYEPIWLDETRGFKTALMTHDQAVGTGISIYCTNNKRGIAYFNSEFLKYVAEQGYTTVTVKYSKKANGMAFGNVRGGTLKASNGLATNTLKSIYSVHNAEITFEISKLVATDEVNGYRLGFDTNQSSSTSYICIESLTFSK